MTAHCCAHCVLSRIDYLRRFGNSKSPCKMRSSMPSTLLLPVRPLSMTPLPPQNVHSLSPAYRGRCLCRYTTRGRVLLSPVARWSYLVSPHTVQEHRATTHHQCCGLCQPDYKLKMRTGCSQAVASLEETRSQVEMRARITRPKHRH